MTSPARSVHTPETLPHRNHRCHALYRLYDGADRLLYIGRTTRIRLRMMQHGREKPWWPEVRVITIETYRSAEALAAAEKTAITVETPIYNKQLGREDWPPRLTDEQQLERRAEILRLHEQGLTFAEIAISLGISETSVYRYRQTPEERRAARKRYPNRDREAQRRARQRWQARNRKRVNQYQREWRQRQREAA